MKINIIIEDTIISANLNHSAAAQDLLEKLPLTLLMHQHQAREYYGNIRLKPNAQKQNGYRLGDIGYWAPGNALVLFYDQGYTSDLSIMGQMTSDFAKLADLPERIQVTIEKVESNDHK